MPRRGHGSRAPALHPLHLGLHRPAEGRGPHHRRLPRLRVDDAPIRLRLPRGRGILVHRRCRLGHRSQLHRLWAARQRRDHADVRGHSDLPVELPFLGRGRQAQGQHLLHRADRDPLVDGRRRGPGEEDLASLAPRARFCRRADQPRGLGLVLQGRRRLALRHRRHVVADRDRRHPDHAAPRRDEAKARFGHAAVLRRSAGDGRRRGQGAGRTLRGQPLHHRILARADAHRLRRP